MMAHPRLLLEKRAALFDDAYRAQSRFVERFAFVMEADGYDMSGCFRFRDYLGHELQRVLDDLAGLPVRVDGSDHPPLTQDQMRARIVSIRSEGDAA